jgi:hypothetical protein
MLELTSLTREGFRPLVPPCEAAFHAHRADGRLDGKPRTARRYRTDTNCPLATPEDRLLVSLVSQQTSPLPVVQGRLFGMGQSTAQQWMHALWVAIRATWMISSTNRPLRTISAKCYRLSQRLPPSYRICLKRPRARVATSLPIPGQEPLQPVAVLRLEPVARR